MSIKTVNQKIACSPFPKNSLTSTVKGGVAVIDQQQSLQPLTVVFPTEDTETVFLEPGEVVYVNGDRFNTAWAKAKYKVDDKEFILVPWSEVVAITR